MDDTAQPRPTGQPSIPSPQPTKDYQQAYDAGGKFKEQLEMIAGSFRERSAAAEPEVRAVEEIPSGVEEEKLKEAEGYIEKIEKEAELAAPVVDDYTRQVLVGAAAPQKLKVTLPLTDDQIKLGLHHKIWEGIRWLAEWCARQIKILARVNQ